MSSRACRSFHTRPKKRAHKSARKGKTQTRKLHDSDYDFDNYHARSMTPKRKVKDLRIRALSLNFELFVKERELTFFVNEFLKMRCFQLWRRLLGRALLDRVTALKNRRSQGERRSPIRAGVGGSLMLEPLSEDEDMRVTVAHTRPEVEQVKLDLSDEFVIAAITPRLEIAPVPASETHGPSEFVMLDSEDEPVSVIPKPRSPLRSAEIPGRLSPKQIVEEEFQSVSYARPPKTVTVTTSFEACPTLPDDLFSSNVYQTRVSRRAKERRILESLSEEDTTTSTGEKQREVDILKSALRKISKSPSKSHAQRELKRVILSEEYNESTEDDFRPRRRSDASEEESAPERPVGRRPWGARQGDELSDLSTDFSLSSSTTETRVKQRQSRGGRRDLSEEYSSVDDGFRITESEEATEEPAPREEESTDSSAAIEFLLREPVATPKGRSF